MNLFLYNPEYGILFSTIEYKNSRKLFNTINTNNIDNQLNTLQSNFLL